MQRRGSGRRFRAYITGNVASNLIGRLAAAALADHSCLRSNFLACAALNLAGALLAVATLHRTTDRDQPAASRSSNFAIWARHLFNPILQSAFGIGLCLLFAFLARSPS